MNFTLENPCLYQKTSNRIYRSICLQQMSMKQNKTQQKKKEKACKNNKTKKLILSDSPVFHLKPCLELHLI